MKWEWEYVAETVPKCLALRGKRGTVKCELREGHVGGHLGRGVLGQWFVWREEEYICK